MPKVIGRDEELDYGDASKESVLRRAERDWKGMGKEQQNMAQEIEDSVRGYKKKDNSPDYKPHVRSPYKDL